MATPLQPRLSQRLRAARWLSRFRELSRSIRDLFPRREAQRPCRLCGIGKAVTFVSYRRGSPREPWSFYIAKADSERSAVELLAIFPNIFDTIVREPGLQWVRTEAPHNGN
jgi:hypothetical protein